MLDNNYFGFKERVREISQGQRSRSPHVLDLPTSEKDLVSCRSGASLRLFCCIKPAKKLLLICRIQARVEQREGRFEAIPTSFRLFERLSLIHRESFYLDRDKRMYDSI